jgi:hypothetical protein
MAISRFSTSTVAQGLPKYQDVWDGATVILPTTGFVALATQTVGAGGATSVTFGSIPQIYKHLQIRATVRGTLAQPYDHIVFTVNGTTSGYYRHLLLNDGINPPESYAYTNESKLSFGYISGNSATSSVFGGVVLDIFDYTNTNKRKTVRSFNGFNQNSGGGGGQYLGMSSGTYASTNAITSIEIKSESANIAQYSHFALYGIQG